MIGHSSVRLGLLLPTREEVVADRSDPAGLLDLAAHAEALGFDSVWAGESPVARPRLNPLVLLSGVAACTKRVGLGTAVLLPALRSPVMLAQAAASLDRLSGGRLILGFGAGFPFRATEAEFVACGVPFERRIGRLVETVEILRLLWGTEAPVSFEGRDWRLEGLKLEPRPAQAGGPPLWLAGGGPQALRRTGRLFDGWLPYSPTAELFAESLAVVRAEAEEAGRPGSDVLPAVYLTVALDEHPDRAEKALARYTDAYYGLPLENMRRLQAFYGGDAAGLRTWIRSYVDAGARHIVLRLATLGSVRPMAAIVAAEVLPAVREHSSVTEGAM